jgi:uncharacterized protein YecE (DUF72 family)
MVPPTTSARNLRIGTSGWNYPTGRGTWNGIFYPPARGRKKGPGGFDELAFYADHFDTVEVNSTFYGQPRAAVSRRWSERTPAGFEFSVKLHQTFTHRKMFDTPSHADCDEFRRGIEPLAEAGKLGALLAQFPPSFKDTPASREYLTGLLRMFADYPVAVELRHGTWSDRIGDTLGLLNDFRAAWTQIDEPKFTFSIRQNYLPNVSGFYYMRLHGRNADQWWKHDHAEDRYNYLYSASELREFSDVAGAARRIVKKLYLYTNNHFSAKSVANAAMLKSQLGEPVEGEYPPEFLARYPDLAGVVLTPSHTSA